MNSSKLDKNYYGALGITRDVTGVALKKAYKQAALLAHPDKGGTDDLMTKVNEAYQILSDDVKRAQYDRVSTFII